jgi:Zn-dependent protease
VLWALGQPAAFAGLVVAFLLALTLRALAIRITARVLGLAPPREPVTPRPREDIDPFGAVAAAIGGVGWGRVIDVDEVPRHRGRGRAAAVFAAGPVITLLAGELALAGYATLIPPSGALLLYQPSMVLRGAVDETVVGQAMLAVAVGLLCFGLLSLIPLPPLDGFGLLWSAFRRPGTTAQQAKLWLGDNNIGVAALLVLFFFPFGQPLLFVLIDLVGTPLMRMWA